MGVLIFGAFSKLWTSISRLAFVAGRCGAQCWESDSSEKASIQFKDDLTRLCEILQSRPRRFYP